MKTVAEYVMDFFVEKRLEDIFTVSGGGIMYLLDALGQNKRLQYTTTYHEQAAAIACESYYRACGKMAICLVTTGPGSTNTITGVAGAWYDSIPMIVIAGQVRTQVMADYSKIRQQAPQEVNIIPMVQPVTKYAVMITDPSTIKYELEKAYFLALSGRPGPVWISLPLDIQNSTIDEMHQSSFVPPSSATQNSLDSNIMNTVVQRMNAAKRPLLLLGNGVKISGALKEVIPFIDALQIPTVTTINAMDVVPEEHPLFIGRIGPSGQRRSNFALQQCDTLLSIGSSLNIVTTGFDINHFAWKAEKIVVNIDKSEIEKTALSIAYPVVSDAKKFIQTYSSIITHPLNTDPAWIPAVQRWKLQFPPTLPTFYQQKKYVNTYAFFDVLSDVIPANTTVVTGVGQDAVSFFQIFRTKKNQTAYVNINFGQMGWCLPAALGASIAKKKNPVVLVTGDGSIQFNLHELQTIAQYHLPISIFIINNQGYKSIRDTQNNLFQGRLVGADHTSGVENPNFAKLAAGFNLPFMRLQKNSKLNETITRVCSHVGPIVCEVMVDPQQERIPRSGTFVNSEGKLQSAPIEDLLPQIPRKEFEEIMHEF